MKKNRIELVVFDLAGTVVDYGSRAPAGAFCELFGRHGITATEREARAPMGKHKRDHIAEMLAMPSIAKQWKEKRGKDWNVADLDALFDEFLPLQLEALPQYSEAIPGVAAMLETLRMMGVKTAATTGYNNAMTDLLLHKLAAQDVAFDFACCAAEVAAGRPRPWMIFHCMEALDVCPAGAVINIGDTIADVQADVNAGVWSVGVTKTGNMTGLSREETERLNPEQLAFMFEAAGDVMRDDGADAVVESAADLPRMLRIIGEELERGRLPGATRGNLFRHEPALNRILEKGSRPAAAISLR